jgi:predicted lipoprotein
MKTDTAGTRSPKNIGLVWGLAIIVAFLAILSAWNGIATIRPINAENSGGDVNSAVPGSAFRTSKGFDQVAYVDSIWDSKVLPTALNNANDLPAVLTALATNPDAAGAKYGHKELGAPYNFIVKADGQVTVVDTTSRVGLITLKVAGYDGPDVVQVQVGPVIQGTSIRDGIGFIHFEQFLNQIEHALVAEELNNRVLKVVLKGIDPATLKGKTVTVYGIFTMGEEIQKIIITPLKLDVKG